MPTYKTPGVYVEEISVFPPSVAQVETAIPAFIGYTEKATKTTLNDLNMLPTRISSLKEFEQYYGNAFPETISLNVVETQDSGAVIARDLTIASVSTIKFYLYYQLQMYFRNGGGPCYIVSVGLFSANPGAAAINTALTNGLAAVEGVDEPTLLVFSDTNILSAAQHNALSSAALAQAGKLMDRFAIIDVHESSATPLTDIAAFRSSSDLGNNNLSYGAAYYPMIKTSLTPHYTNATTTIAVHDDGAGGDGPFLGATLATVLAADETFYREINNKLADALLQHQIDLYPSGAVAGIYATVDAARGVWKAPANISIFGIRGTVVNVTDEQQGQMNVDAGSGKSVNAIRTFNGRGTLVWGARTLAGNDNEWRYISVRRFYNMVEESVKKASANFVFEPNNANTWVKVRAMIENFLTLQWRAGALAGAKAEDAFFVRVGLGQTMSAQDILEGRLIVEIGMAAVRPAEFIILRFSHMMQQS